MSDSPEGGAPRDERAEKEERRRRIPWFAYPGMLFAPVLLGLAVAVAHYTAEGPSMAPTLSAGDHFLILRQLFVGDPQAGMVVVVASPYDHIEVVKRVIAGPGTTVEMRDDEVFVDGRSIRVGESPCPDDLDVDDPVCFTERIGEREWQTVQSRLSYPDAFPPQTVPEGTVFVLGDHRDRSNDSRNPRVGVIPFDNCVGSVFWP